LKLVEQYLDRFFIENRQSQFWCDCTDVWRRRYREEYDKYENVESEGILSFCDYLHADGFTERNTDSFRESDEVSHHTDNYVNDDFAGFFMRDTKSGQVTSVWQCLNPRGFIDRVGPIVDSRLGPLVTTSNKLVRSCLVAHLNPTTPAPDAFVDRGEWHIRNAMDPVTGKELVFQPFYRHEPWNGYFLRHVEKCSPNTRVTAVQCHY